MTIEEYETILRAEIGISDTAIKKIGNPDEKAARFYEGQIEGLKIALDLLKKLEHDVTLKEFKEYCLRQPYLTGTDKLKTFCGIDLDGVENAIKADIKCRAYGVDPQQYVLDKLAALAEEKPVSPSLMAVSPVEGLTVVSADQVEGGPIVRLLMNSKEEWFVVYKNDEQVSQKLKSVERATRLYEKICGFQRFCIKGGEDDDK